ncbi:protein eva-1 homolog C isoform X2 [Callorhinchus milii]|uniref:SUEL-type lectin domain-containing protein n=1 Tax=Callorhinchus milii TaxID=7868 RepID=A0A4W3IHP9_CALMI|nr:protein eva-1 homolog C isoform X2 [Callorhinchus milii]|eukprot:gi/632976625/ref/XP_007904899.1/ PREDICTED: protein eva-1 homolog C isoform X2 [Callorhinchus milii]
MATRQEGFKQHVSLPRLCGHIMFLLHGCQRRQIPVLVSLMCILLTWTEDISALGVFSGYLSKVLRNHTEHACDGGHLKLICPRGTTLSVQSAFYGREVPSSQLCPSLRPTDTGEENMNCSAPTTLQKILDECQDHHSCQLLVNRRVFGLDPCPGTSKYLLVSYKCKPNEYKSKVACEGRELKIRCSNSTLINVYSATYGRILHGNKACPPSNPQLPNQECVSHTALEIMARNCYGKRSCRVNVSSRYFGDPCFPGMEKYLSIVYVCAHIPSQAQKFRFSMKEGEVFITSLATFAYIQRHLEMAGLLFMSSVCIGLILTLCVLVIRVPCRSDLQKLWNHSHHRRTIDGYEDDDDDDDDSTEAEDSGDGGRGGDEEKSSDFSFEALTNLYGTAEPSSAEAVEIAERIERRDRIIQEIWMNGGLELPTMRTLNQYY